jgi:hypothetical protein
MKSTRKSILLLVLILALTSCSAFAPQPTETPVPTLTPLPTLTSTPPPTLTTTPTQTPTVTPLPPTEVPTQTPLPPTKTPSAAGLPMPAGEPAAEWEGIPVMPAALAGEGDSTGYSFTIQASTEEIQAFYEKEMPRLGWELLASGQGTTNAILLIFMKGSGTASVSIIPQASGLVYVLLVK